MRFKNYLTEDDRIKTFQSLQIKLVESPTGHTKVISFIDERYGLSLGVDKIISKFNSNLKELYKGKYKFDLCIDEGINPDDLKKLSNKQLTEIKKEWYRINDEFAKIQKVFEKHLQNYIGGQI